MLVSFGITEVNQQTIAHVAGDVAVETLDDALATRVKALDDLAQIFRIEASRQGGGTDQVAKHYGEVAALALGFVHRGGLPGRCRRGTRRRRQSGNRLH